MSLLKKKEEVVEEEVSLEDLDDLLQALTAEEIEELNGDFDPDNSLLPPSQRCKDQTSKAETGPFSRKHLITFLEDKAKHEKDWENQVPYTQEPKGKKFIPKEPEKVRIFDDEEDFETEWDDILAAASEEELVDLAAVLGFHSMLTQTQYHAALVEGEELSKTDGGFRGSAQAQKLRLVPDELPNMTDVEGSISKLKANDPELKSLNINNIKNQSIERLVNICEALKDNTVCVKLDMASVAANDAVAKALASTLESNTTLKSVNVESNFITPEGILSLLKAINHEKQTLIELRVSNQKPEVLGNRVEMEISKLVNENSTLLRFGISFEFPAARIKVNDKLKTNFDALRQKRNEAST